GVHRRGAPAASIGAGEEVILAADRDAAQGALGRVVVEREPAVVEAAHQRGPPRPHVAEGSGELRFTRQLAPGLVGPDGQRRGDWFRSLLTFSSAVIGHAAVDLLLDVVKLANAFAVGEPLAACTSKNLRLTLAQLAAATMRFPAHRSLNPA